LLLLVLVLLLLLLFDNLPRVAFVLSRQNASQAGEQCGVETRFVRRHPMLIVLASANLHARVGGEHVRKIGHAHASDLAGTLANVVSVQALSDV
jgi:hypothetical protein